MKNVYAAVIIGNGNILLAKRALACIPIAEWIVHDRKN